MARIFPFRAQIADTDKVNPGELPAAIEQGSAPPMLRAWQQSGALRQADAPSFYACYQRLDAGGETVDRKGLVALVEAVETGGALTSYHDEHEDRVAARLELMLQTDANLLPVCVFYSDPSFRINRALDSLAAAGEPDSRVEIEGGEQLLWRVSDATLIKRFQRTLEDKKIRIADGISTYVAAVRYRERMRERGVGDAGEDSPRYTMVTLFNIDQPEMADVREHAEHGGEEEQLIHPPLVPGQIVNKISAG